MLDCQAGVDEGIGGSSVVLAPVTPAFGLRLATLVDGLR